MNVTLWIVSVLIATLLGALIVWAMRSLVTLTEHDGETVTSPSIVGTNVAPRADWRGDRIWALTLVGGAAVLFLWGMGRL